MSKECVWVFHSAGARFAGGTFSSVESAELWIGTHKLTGVLTSYPLDTGAYEWAVKNEYFQPKKEKHSTAEFIGGFTSANQEHYHYENGQQA
ncbi:hypothetical protein P3339_18880 [Microbulbifer sp. MLAF003]|uniref:DUF7710 domain-containing protein n=1 Tax=Microbulbifer TaxID=48073 RepID=UPI0003723C75|nr:MULTISPECIES: hypothetical protein [Microbulbifer]WHI50482.1 hypothetical protein P3339_18880 [Microbulbifer sp. MLAF003]